MCVYIYTHDEVIFQHYHCHRCGYRCQDHRHTCRWCKWVGLRSRRRWCSFHRAQLEIACVRKGRLERMKRRKRAKKWKYKFKVAMWIIFNYLWIVWGLCGSVIYNVFDVDGCRGGWYWCECMLHSMWNLSAFNITAWTTYQGTIFFLSKEGKGAINLHKTTKMISQAFYLVGKKGKTKGVKI